MRSTAEFHRIGRQSIPSLIGELLFIFGGGTLLFSIGLDAILKDTIEATTIGFTVLGSVILIIGLGRVFQLRKGRPYFVLSMTEEKFEWSGKKKIHSTPVDRIVACYWDDGEGLTVNFETIEGKTIRLPEIESILGKKSREEFQIYLRQHHPRIKVHGTLSQMGMGRVPKSKKVV